MVGPMLIAEAGKIVLSGRVLCSRLEAKSVTLVNISVVATSILLQ
jgi:hypothetical protein